MKKKFIKIGNLKVEIPEDTQATIAPDATETTENLNSESQVTNTAEPVVIGNKEKKEDDGDRKSYALYYAAAGVSAVLFLFLAVALFLRHNQSGSQNENVAVKEATTTTKEPQKPVVVNHVKKTKKPVVVVVEHKKHITNQQPLIRKVTAATTTTTTTVTSTTIKPETTTLPTTTVTLPKAVVKPLPLRLGVQITNSASPQGHVVNFQITTYDSKGVVPYQTIVIVNNSCQPSTVKGQTGIDGQFNATVACNNGSGIMATVSSGNQSETVSSAW